MEKRGWFTLPIISSFSVVLLVFKPYACFPRRPRTKGKGVRPFLSLRNQFLRGLAVQALSELEPLLAEFTEKESHRRHSVFKETPHERFQARKNRSSIPSRG